MSNYEKYKNITEVEGRIYNIIYEADDGFKILNIINGNSTTTLKGNMPSIEEGDNIFAKGNFVTHKKYGTQFNVSYFEKIFPKEKDEILEYLQSGAIKNVGKKLAGKIVTEFGDDTLDVIYNEPERLSDISGISKQKANDIGVEFRSKREYFDLVKYLKPYNLKNADIAKLYEKYKENTLDILRKNPYIMVNTLVSISFNDIDKIALREGIPLDNENRINSAIMYLMNISVKNGNTYVGKEELVSEVIKVTGASEELVGICITNLSVKGLLDVTDDEVSLEPVSIAEKEIAEKLIRLKNGKARKIRNIEKKISNLESDLSITLTDDQKDAIMAVADNNVTVITGGPGTGKTTITKFIVSIFENNGLDVQIAAPTGKAAKRISDVTDHDASTIHRMLEIGKYDDDNYSAIFMDTKELDCDVLIIDEASMIDIFMMTYILRGIKEGKRLVLIGDIYQLPSVGPGKVLEDIIASETVTVVKLNTIFRQAAKSNIVLNAHRVNEGKNIEILNDDKHIDDFKIIYTNSDESTYNTLLNVLSDEIKDVGFEDFFLSSQILTPSKRGICGTYNLNKEVQAEFNENCIIAREEQENNIEEKDKIRSLNYGNTEYYEDDRVIQIKNDYDMTWEQNYKVGSGIFNGEMGVVTDLTSRRINVLFDDGKEATYTRGDLENIIHSYAITVHKSQGSEFKTVILVLPNASPMLLNRNILYTAMSRAKEKLIIIGEENILNRMIDTVRSNNRKTKLKKSLIGIDIKSNNKKVKEKESKAKTKKNKTKTK